MSNSINIFVSRPTVIGPDYEAAYKRFHRWASGKDLVLRRLGKSDYSRKAPLQAVINIIDQCYGAIVLGYPQVEFHSEVRRGSLVEGKSGYAFPTPWNQIEGALAYRCKAPVLVVAHTGISGGVFDHGITGETVIHIELNQLDWYKKPQFMQPFDEWRTETEEWLQKKAGVA
jgi:hypothetical protein